MHEVKVFHSLDHPNVLKFFSWYETRNHLWVITEYCSGGDLLRLVEQDKQLPEDVVLDFAEDLVRGLLYLHSNGVIFGDLKPSNILLNEFGALKLSDFGLARKIVDMVQFEADNKRGTPCYMAPELFQETGVHSVHSDMWSLGCVIYEMASGSPPFTSSNIKELVNLILNKTVDPLPNCSPEFNQLMAELLVKDPSRRISWDELVQLPLWKDKLLGLQFDLPTQPLYEQYLVSRGVSQRSFGSSVDSQCDVLRVSQAVQLNISREQAKEAQLKDRDRVIDFGGHQEEDEENYANIELSIFENESLPTQLFKPPSGETLKITQLALFKSRTKSSIGDDPEEERLVTSHGRSNSEHTVHTPPVSRSLAPLPLDQLILHTSDTAVMPIRDIEEFQNPPVNFAILPFAPLTAADLTEDTEASLLHVHISDIFEALRQKTQDNSNLLNYFESLIVNGKVANVFFNNVVVNYFVGLLRSSSSSSLKPRVCSIIASMTRHATVIDPAVVRTGLVVVLAEQLKASSVPLRRKAMCALGEIMFYCATQMDEDNSDRIWEISQSLAIQVIRCLKSTEDEVVQAYAVKTVENITAQCHVCGPMFTGSDVMHQMVTLVSSSQEKLRVPAAVILSHIARLNPSVLPSLIKELTPSIFCSLLADGPSRVQQAFITMLILALQHSPKIVYTLHEHKPFLPTLVSLLEHSATIVRGKTVLAFLLLFRQNAKWMIAVSDLRFYSIIDKLQRDSYKYIQFCLFHLVEIMVEIANLVIRNVLDELTRPGDVARSACSLLPIVFYIVSTQSTRNKIAYSNFVKNLANTVIVSQKLKPEHGDVLIRILEALSTHQKALVTHAEAVVTALLPSLLSQVQCADVKVRFSFWKLFTDFTIICIMDEDVFDLRNQTKLSSKGLADILLKQLPPLLRNLLCDTDPISLCTLKLLSVVVERCPPIIEALKRTSLIGDLFANFEAGNSKLSSSLISIIKAVVKSREFSIEELSVLSVPQKLNSVLKLVETQQQDWCLDLLLDIVYEILFETSKSLRNQKNTGDSSILETSGDIVLAYAQPLLENFSFFCGLLTASPVSYRQTLSEKAGHCLALLLQLFSLKFIQQSQPCRGVGIEFEGSVKVSKRIQDLQSLLVCNKPSLQKRTLKLIELALKAPENPFAAQAENLASLAVVLDTLTEHEDASIAASAT